MTHKLPSVLLIAGLPLGGGAWAAPSAQDSDLVPPNSPLKERGFPDAGKFNPNDDGALRTDVVMRAAPAAATYYPPVIVIDAPPPRPYALVAAPTLPCAPAYCPRLRPRVDRN